MGRDGLRFQSHIAFRIRLRGVTAVLPDGTTIRGLFRDISETERTTFDREGRFNPTAVEVRIFQAMEDVPLNTAGKGTVLAFPNGGTYKVDRSQQKWEDDEYVCTYHVVYRERLPS